ncbi:hypothetical protein KR51_00000070 [Rubidibacter lacunae KORDI 51-2]|uniref:Nuclear transport factor 2 family protein n=1 Tax=Rubidibacter lacunae KORDI 51-2 TaxID=582515 RepID=U5DR90_9CHRO|nr:hypothetical protein [Rubidibacter lacunae]ERN43119.1 hypothetical protein KR51_00000070 [Rubidibacter lacunae KORDI 51-2]
MFRRRRTRSLVLPALLTCSLVLLSPSIRAESPASAPDSLQQLLIDMERAASSQDLQSVMEHYSPDFTNSDGLDFTSLSLGLTQLWEEYDSIDYTIELQSWDRNGTDLIAETLTRVTGVRRVGARDIRLSAEIVSRQRLSGDRIVEQEILSERSQILTGANPPQVSVKLPDAVATGEMFDFDVVVDEPLGDDVLLGAVLEERVTNLTQLSDSALDIDVLPAGGIFQIGTAPDEPGDEWLSAVLIRSDGITVVTQRLRIEAGEPSAEAAP